jgi:hypothetical protein
MKHAAEAAESELGRESCRSESPSSTSLLLEGWIHRVAHD